MAHYSLVITSFFIGYLWQYVTFFFTSGTEKVNSKLFISNVYEICVKIYIFLNLTLLA